MKFDISLPSKNLSILLDIESVFKEHYNYLCRLSYNVVRDTQDAEDLVQGVFLKLWDKKEQLNINKEIKSYLSSAVINASLDFVSKNKLRLSKSFTQNDQNTLATDSKVNLTELELKLEEALKQLPEKCRVIFCLSRFEAMTSQQIADHMDLSKKTIDNQIGIALKKLREELSDFLTLPSFPYHIFNFIFKKTSRL